MSLTLRTARDSLTVSLTAASFFLFFGAASKGVSRFMGRALESPEPSVAVRALVALVVAVVLLVAERRRTRNSAAEALIEGLQMAVLVVAVVIIPGTASFGMETALRSAMVLFGLPLLTLETHVLAKTRLG